MMKHKISSTSKADHLAVGSCANEECKGLVHSNERPDGSVVYSCNKCARTHERIPVGVEDGKVTFIYALPGKRRKYHE